MRGLSGERMHPSVRIRVFPPRVEDAFAQCQNLVIGTMQPKQHPKVGQFKIPAWPVRFEGKPAAVKPSPLIGENTGDVLKSWLGKSEADVAKLKSAKIAGA